MLKKVLFLILSLLVLISVIYFVEPPKSWPEASSVQLISIFLPLLITTTLLIDLLLDYLPHSFIISTGLVLLLSLYSINALTLISGISVLILIAILLKLFPKIRLPRFRLTKVDKIPKLTGLSRTKKR